MKTGKIGKENSKPDKKESPEDNVIGLVSKRPKNANKCYDGGFLLEIGEGGDDKKDVKRG